MAADKTLESHSERATWNVDFVYKKAKTLCYSEFVSNPKPKYVNEVISGLIGWLYCFYDKATKLRYVNFVLKLTQYNLK